MYNSEQTTGTHPLFLLGAGFNHDANREVECASGKNHDLPAECRYPLLADLWDCFQFGGIPEGTSIEVMFAECIRMRDFEPQKQLVKKLVEADHYIGSRLAEPQFVSRYSQFFDRFPRSHFLTFNYDALVEKILFNNGRWRPDDGFGVPVEVDLHWRAPRPPVAASDSLVIHLHGSIYLSPDEFEVDHQEVREREKPLLRFAPVQDRDMFWPFDGSPSLGQVLPHDRFVAPVPDKAEGLRGVIVREMYKKACELTLSVGVLVSIGYSFNPNDEASFAPLLNALSKSSSRHLIIVAPDACAIAMRLRGFRGINIDPRPFGFVAWAEKGYPGL